MTAGQDDLEEQAEHGQADRHVHHPQQHLREPLARQLRRSQRLAAYVLDRRRLRHAVEPDALGDRGEPVALTAQPGQ
jgi:hypothetical protein